MSIQYVLGCPPKWSEWNFGEELALGKIYTYHSNDHTSQKATYKDPNGGTPHSNPIVLDAYGRSLFPIYFINDPDEDNYYIEVKTASDVTVYTVDNYNGALISQDQPDEQEVEGNIIRNPQFNIWDHLPVNQTTSFNVSTIALGADNLACDDWWFSKSNNTSTDTISRQNVTPGDGTLIGNPRFYFQLGCSAAGTETTKYLYQFYQGATFLANTQVTLTFQAKANAEGVLLNLLWQQYFGTGGAPSGTVTTTIGQQSLNTAFQTYTFTFTIPTVSGKAIGTNFDDYSYFLFSFPVGSTFTIGITNVQIKVGSESATFQIESIEQQQAKLDSMFQLSTGEMSIFLTDITPWGWLRATDGTIGNAASGANYAQTLYFNLYTYLWNNFQDPQCPVSTGRGVSAVADWNANKTIRMPLTRSRLIGASGAGAGLTNRVNGVTGGAETFTLTTTQLPAHTHTFAAGSGHVPYDLVGFSDQDNMTGGGIINNFVVHNGSLGDITATDSSGTGSAFNIMDPFSFLPFYIHI